LLNIEGLGRQLYPELDLWSTAKPYLERWMRERFGPKAAWKEFKRQLPGWVEKAPQMPGLVHGALTRLNHMDENQLQIQKQLTELNLALEAQRTQKRHQTLGLVTMITGGALWWQSYALALPEFAGLAVASTGLVWLLVKG